MSSGGCGLGVVAVSPGGLLAVEGVVVEAAVEDADEAVQLPRARCERSEPRNQPTAGLRSRRGQSSLINTGGSVGRPAPDDRTPAHHRLPSPAALSPPPTRTRGPRAHGQTHASPRRAHRGPAVWLVSRLGRCAPLAPQPTTNRSRWLRCERSEPRNQPTADLRSRRGPEFLDQHLADPLADPHPTTYPSPPRPPVAGRSSHRLPAPEDLVRTAKPCKPAESPPRACGVDGFEARALRSARTSTNDSARRARVP